MKKYCFDTSGISNPLEFMPEDIHGWMWNRMIEFIQSGAVAVTKEIYDEMIHIGGRIGDCIRKNEDMMVLEVNKGDWGWEVYTRHVAEMQQRHHHFISEYNGGSRRTICLNDLSMLIGLTPKATSCSMRGERSIPPCSPRRSCSPATISRSLAPCLSSRSSFPMTSPAPPTWRQSVGATDSAVCGATNPASHIGSPIGLMSSAAASARRTIG
jgi:hypothetical protein